MRQSSAGLSFRSLHLSLRFVLPLAVALGLLAYGVVPLIDGLMLRWSVRDMDIRSRLISSTLQDPLSELMRKGERQRISSLLVRVNQDERLLALGVCDNESRLLYKTPAFPAALSCRQPEHSGSDPEHLIRLPQGPVHVAVSPIGDESGSVGSLVLIHDMSFMERRSADTRQYVILLFAVLGVVISLITVFVAHLSWRGWMEGVRAMLRGEGILRPFAGQQAVTSSELQPLVGDLRALLRTLDAERRFADDATIFWSADTLRKLLHKELSGDQVLVVSNREPYIHSQEGETIRVQRPASGLVTAVEPVMKACSGTWIAHGSGSADRQTVDAHDRVGVPPEKPAYTLRRIWLSREEESGYYYGFANEGLWPLCHIAHVRPVFRSNDWQQYVAINRRFADAVVREAKTDDPVVLVQDYHLALLPGYIRAALPKATVITFWHIPWPNPESFGICPWREEVLQGMLGSTILGFHTPFHCKNFIETVDRYLETRIEHESSTISHNGKLTMVESYPISIQWPSPWQESQASVEECAREIRSSLGIGPDCLVGIGVDRLDYTKGILERFWAVERMLELHPELVGRFTFIQIAAPTRTALDDYQNFDAQVRALAARINKRFATASWQPLVLRIEHHEPEEVNRYYRAADVCMVTSLHDGMNLVAKEYVAARDDERGALVLSQFTGAAHELHEALLVNPYHIEQTAEALHEALVMPEYEQRERMRSMRALVRDFNVYRWAGRMLLDAARIRQREKLAARIGGLARVR
ncbi:alpha,alpha-trehalose-phosphate synthase (UDP-forming) [Trichlorobacter ammonificans]|uniref:Alpha,alpha-trehalose-phosphate synthase (UDP-forming) n=1 Tax=Trichlorobacter ammonificans TaxID=2916410 RepID=A0ABN8HHF3_9BACT|nr:trehalose-6-phosphate synthase [Trichlorobacter ammonificans]CAH2030914.1 Alpha,alpha-trehalose-phosphate synthase (UDP-forming) [Trichlorobacter ammonificans]